MDETQKGRKIQERSKGLLEKYWVFLAAIVLLAVLVVASIYQWRNGRRSSTPADSPNRGESSLTKVIDPYQLALGKVEEDRGAPTGDKAEVKIPAELKLYKDRRRFLAIQVAEWRRQKYQIPDDFSELAALTKQGEMVSVPPLGPDYILYGVGLKANDELTHYDQRTGKSIPLFASEAELETEMQKLKDSLAEFETKIREARDELAQVKKTERALRREKLDYVANLQKLAAAVKARRDLLSSFYQSKAHRQLMLDEYQRLAELASSYDGQSYDLNLADARKKFKMNLLSALRPAALAQLKEIAEAYRQKFQRPLPITSLVRTREYQRQLGEAGNPNAIQIAVPPHTTGLAFDIYTYYMAADEQQFLLDEIARLEREGRLEALRENRNHIHVFAFAGEGLPSERLIKESLDWKALKATE
jgi:hypothetical protein